MSYFDKQVSESIVGMLHTHTLLPAKLMSCVATMRTLVEQ